MRLIKSISLGLLLNRTASKKNWISKYWIKKTQLHLGLKETNIKQPHTKDILILLYTKS